MTEYKKDVTSFSYSTPQDVPEDCHLDAWLLAFVMLQVSSGIISHYDILVPPLADVQLNSVYTVEFPIICTR